MKQKRYAESTREDVCAYFKELRDAAIEALARQYHSMDPFTVRCIEVAIARAEAWEQNIPQAPPKKRTQKENRKFVQTSDFLLEYYIEIDKMLKGKITFPLSQQ